jgi:APA family basic amino acid/polyamine antiporter
MTVLERRLGPVDAAAIIVANVIGGGILFTPPQVAAAVPNAALFLATWVAGGLLAFAGAMAYAELAAQRPRAGGEYVYLGAAFGPVAGFLTGWTSFVAGFSGAIAASAVVLTFYLGRFIPCAADATPFFTLPVVTDWIVLRVSPQSVVALTAILGLAWLHIRGIGPARLVGNVLAALKVTALVLFVACGFAIGSGATSTASTAVAAVSPAGWLLALVPIMFTYSGWNAASYVAEEIREPGKNAPRAFAIGVGVVALVYLGLNALSLRVLSVGELAGISGSVLDVVADRMFGASAGHVIAVISIVSLLASLSAMTFAGPRVYFAMARDGAFLGRAANVHPRYRTPAWAILAQAVWSIVLVLTASANALVTYTGFAIVLFSGLAVSALFVLRRREPHADRPYRTWGYPVVPAIYVVSSILIIANGLWTAPGPAGAGVLVILAGLPIYAWCRSQRPARSPSPLSQHLVHGDADAGR